MSPERKMSLFRVLIALVAFHSCLLGLAMLFFPLWMVRFFDFPSEGEIFFPSQSGIFLVILGLCYFLALQRAALIWVVLISKSLAVLFLLTHSLFLAAPPSVAAAALGDAVMLAAVTVTGWRLGWDRVFGDGS